MKRIQRHQRNRGCAIWIRDNTALLPRIFRIDFRNNERHMRLHPEGRGIVDHDGVGLAGDWHKLARDVAAGAEKGDVDIIERTLAEFLDRN